MRFRGRHLGYLGDAVAFLAAWACAIEMIRQRSDSFAAILALIFLLILFPMGTYWVLIRCLFRAMSFARAIEWRESLAATPISVPRYLGGALGPVALSASLPMLTSAPVHLAILLPEMTSANEFLAVLIGLGLVAVLTPAIALALFLHALAALLAPGSNSIAILLGTLAAFPIIVTCFVYLAAKSLGSLGSNNGVVFLLLPVTISVLVALIPFMMNRWTTACARFSRPAESAEGSEGY